MSRKQKKQKKFSPLEPPQLYVEEDMDDLDAMFAVIDMETSGLPLQPSFGTFFPPSDLLAFEQSRMIEVALVLFNNQGVEVDSFCCVVKPSGQWKMDPCAELIHGISKEAIDADGVPVSLCLRNLNVKLRRWKAINGGVIPVLVGHNIMFDWSVLASESFRANHMRLFHKLCKTPTFCTMQGSTYQCNLKRNGGGLKWPKLSELHQLLFQEAIGTAHTAMGDVRATARCFFKITSPIGRVLNYPRKINHSAEKKILGPEKTKFRQLTQFAECLGIVN